MWNEEAEKRIRADLENLKPSEQLYVTGETGDVRHRFVAMLTNQSGINTGRGRYLIACTSCEKLMHEATTGPLERMTQHLTEFSRGAKA